MTDTTVVTQDDAERMRKLRAMSGQLVGGSENFIPALQINKTPEKEGFEIPVGVITFRSKTLGEVFAKRKEPVSFRVFAKRYRYTAYSQSYKDTHKGHSGTIGRSIFGADFKVEYISDNGLLRAGKGSAKVPADTAAKCKHIFFGTISFTGTNLKGEPVEVKDEPVSLTMGGKPWKEIDEYITNFSKSGKLLFDYPMALTVTFREGGFYNVNLVFADLTKPVKQDDATFKTLETFSDYINAENKQIEAKYIQAQKNVPTQEEVAADDVVGEPTDVNDDMIEEEETVE
jgi:hypothetical protein